MPTVQEIAIQACKRANLDPTHTLRVQTMVPAALSNLAKAVAKDPMRRNQLMTTPGSVTSTISTSGSRGISDLSTLVSANGIMLDSLKYGTIYYTQSFTFAAAAVDVGSQIITVTNNFVTGQAIVFSTSGTLPSGLTAGTTYYVGSTSTSVFITLATSSGAAVPFTTQGTGTHTVTAATEEGTIAQWLGSPAQGTLTPLIPFNYTYVWLVGDVLYTNRVRGSFGYAVPYQPTLADFPDDDELLEDLIDTLVAIVLAAGIEDTPPDGN